MLNERELLKKKWIKKVATCKMCGKTFYKFRYDKLHYCPDCLIKHRRKNFKKSLSDDDFKVLYKIFHPHIKRCIHALMIYDYSLFEYAEEQSLVCLWHFWNRLAGRKMSVNDMYKTTEKQIFVIVKQSTCQVLAANDLPKKIYTDRKTKQENFETYYHERFDEPFMKDEKDSENRSRFIADNKMPVDEVLDIKNLTKKIITESITDSDIKAAIVKAETEDIFSRGSNITQKEKCDFLNEEYDLKVNNIHRFAEKAQMGTYKLYNIYAEDIKELLGIAEENFKFKLDGQTVKKNSLKPSVNILRCPICGKSYISKTHRSKTCDSPKCKREYKNMEDKKYKAKHKIEELMLQAQMTNDVEKKQKLCEKLFAKIKDYEVL